jgi:hypothetical protein
MIDFFKFLEGLSPMTQWCLFILVSLLAVAIPNFKFIIDFFKYLVKREALKINSFALHTEIVKDSNKVNTEGFLDKDNNIHIKGNKATLTWDVKGSYRIDIEGVGKKLKGNAAGIILLPHLKSFQLLAYGFGGRRESATIDISPDPLYNLENAHISSAILPRELPVITKESITRLNLMNTELIKLKPLVAKRQKPAEPATAHLNPEPVALGTEERRIYQNAVGRRRLLKGLDYSTKQFNVVGHYFNNLDDINTYNNK